MTKIYHLTTPETWEAAQKKGLYDYCALSSEGFIHFSTKTQFLATANRIFKNLEELLLLEVLETSVKKNLVYENLEGGQELFPHLYTALKTDLVTKTWPMRKGSKKEFTSPFAELH